VLYGRAREVADRATRGEYTRELLRQRGRA
jgi:hypothetical protein